MGLVVKPFSNSAISNKNTSKQTFCCVVGTPGQPLSKSGSSFGWLLSFQPHWTVINTILIAVKENMITIISKLIVVCVLFFWRSSSPLNFFIVCSCKHHHDWYHHLVALIMRVSLLAIVATVCSSKHRFDRLIDALMRTLPPFNGLHVHVHWRDQTMLPQSSLQSAIFVVIDRSCDPPRIRSLWLFTRHLCNKLVASRSLLR